MAGYTPRSSPDHDTKAWPPGVPYIIGNEGCERFSYYGMRSILTLFMAEVLYANHPVFRADPENYAQTHYHLFSAGVYALPIVGAIVADRLLGKYRTILYLSVVYCAGHAVLAAFEHSIYGVWTGLALIALGSGGIKPCVSAHVGDQFGRNNWFRVRSIYQAFYFIINFGSTFSTLLIPWVWRHYGASVAFAIPGILMAIATLCFWMGRKVFVHVPPKPGGNLGLLDALSSTCLFMAVGHLFFSSGWSVWLILLLSVVFLVAGFGLFFLRMSMRPDDGFLAVILASLGLLPEFAARAEREPERALPEILSEKRRAALERLQKSPFFSRAVRRFGVTAVEGPVAVLNIMSVFFLVSVFWALFDQHGSSWILQAKQMHLPEVLGMQLLPSQIPSVNPILVMLLIPFTNLVVYPACERLGFKLSPLRRMTAGMFIAALSFVSVALVQRAIDAGGPGTVHVGWQLIGYGIITLAEVLVSITGLEFAYTQAPPRMKSTIMGFWLLTVAVGNVLVSLISGLGQLPLEQFFWVFAGLMAAAACIFGLRARFYREQDFVQH